MRASPRCSKPWSTSSALLGSLLALLLARPAAAQDPAHKVLDGSDDYQPIGRIPIDRDKGMGFALPTSAALRVEGTSSFEVDRDGNIYGPRAIISPRTRLGLGFTTGKAIDPAVIGAEFEIEFASNNVFSNVGLEGIGYPGAPSQSGGVDIALRKANLKFRFSNAIFFAAGWQTSHWGMGLVANDGDHGWEPGSARFSDPREGDHPIRLAFGTGPLTDAQVVISVAGDFVDNDLLSDDDVVLEGDTATQAVGVLSIGDRLPTEKPDAWGFGVYGALRRQDAPDGDETRVVVADVAGHGRLTFDDVVIAFQGEAVHVRGDTELAPNFTFRERTVWQFATALRASVDQPIFGAVVDFVYASGDRNLDDDQLNAFRADPNFEMGLLMFRHVLTAQTARAAFTAGDPALVGVPSEDLERVPTRGSVTNTIAAFPRLRVRPLDGFEIYGGPLFGLAAQPIADPLETRVRGGFASTAFGDEQAQELGVELDLGLRYRLNIGGAEVTMGAEGGVLFPGQALARSNETIWGGRTMLNGRL